MTTIEFLRQFRLGGYALFDFIASFLGIWLLSPLLTKLFLKMRIKIPKINWIFLTLPIGIIAHLLVNTITPLTKNFLDLSGHYILKILILVLIFFGIRGIKIIKK
ncbi:MAG: hypothetical protein UR53_C0002G0074 [Candidatus Magasanikbacteria bacterium GW2011_GWC2_34_16]|uniref:Uncharacterized protein n=2 Tax=Candidatus Magasanikiibacteriota TaxID=1752731 RepID=A0A0G0HQ31_9BACT|nr:MAG: hypothetical protein UR53_C0002G0074 [Candidatus Magasanikbacteria bacterium GW2011_GWC2_34_16]KKQ40720.1 MAG: hypothetical protein US58_C0013G0020 [Candidatus Magasanikbacteria bacterium GW2011_GWA2_37_8]